MREDAPLRLAPVPWRPTPYMLRAVKFLVEHAAAGLLYDPGLRKTSITLAAIKFLKERRDLRRGLGLAPLRPCYLVWPEEARKWLDFSKLTVKVLHGPDKEDRLGEPADVTVVNFDGLAWLLRAEWRVSGGRRSLWWDKERWARLGFDTLVMDELSKLKHSGTRRHRILRQVLPTFQRRGGLTGSPASNSLLDLHGQAYCLDEGRALGRYVTHYRMRWFAPPFYGSRKWIIKPGAEEEIYARLRPLVRREAAEDHLELPPKLDNVVRVDLPPAARKVYDEMEDELVAALDGGEVVSAANAGAALTKCRQLAGGAVYTEDDAATNKPGRAARTHRGVRAWREVHAAKVEALTDLVDELQGQPVLVAYEFQHDLVRLRAALGEDTPAIGGGTSMGESADVARRWNAGEVPVLLVHPQAAGHGLNLQEAGAHVAWFTLTWDYELYDQLNRRLYRSGVKARRVTIHHLVARGTVDEVVLAALRRKARGQGALFEALRRRGRTSQREVTETKKPGHPRG